MSIRSPTKTNDTSLTASSNSVMDLRPIQAPRLTGSGLVWFARLTRFPGLGKAIMKKIRKDNGFDQVREFAATMHLMPLYYPLQPPKEEQLQEHPNAADSMKSLTTSTASDILRGFRRWTIQDYVNQYKSGDTTPLIVITNVIDAIDASNKRSPPLCAFVKCNREAILEEAKASTARYASQTTLGPLDGVPIAVNDELDVLGYTTSYGTNFLGSVVATQEAAPIARLRKAGAIIVGKTNMHEVGMGSFGINPQLGTPRNPYNDQHMTGGSSSGSAAAVAAGIVPLAIGCDGGGSIRIPSGLCGIVGIKATFMRIPYLFPACPSVGNIGPMAATVQDAALAYMIMSGPDPNIPMSQSQPPPYLLPQSSVPSMQGLRVGVYSDYLEGVDAAVATAFWDTVNYLRHLGATVVEIQIPNLQVMHLSHAVTILTEISQHFETTPIHNFSPDVQVNLGLAYNILESTDFLAAQKIRKYAVDLIDTLFETIDVFLTPTTGILAPRLEADVFSSGLSQLELTTALMRFVVIGNLVGIPGISVPVAFDEATRLPISMQLQSRHWDEHLLFQIAQMLEAHAPTSEPSLYYSPLTQQQ